MKILYGYVLAPLLLGTAWMMALLLPKLRAGLIGRMGWRSRFRHAIQARAEDKPLVWFHVASAGELMQAEPVMQRLRKEGYQLAVSLTSVSGIRWLNRISAWPELVWADLLPFDLPWNIGALMRGLNPAAIVHVQAELWPGLVWAAHSRGIPQVLIAARLGSGKKNYRARFPAHGLYRSLYGRQNIILCATDHDRAGIAEIVPDHPRLEVGGDPGIETVLNRLREAPQPKLPETILPDQATVLIMGSSWPEDENVVLPLLGEYFKEFPALRLILAPHEPSQSRLTQLESALQQWGTCRLSAVDSPPPGNPRVILVDGVGQLASLYRLARMAYVGGAFGTGVHNVAEPAACGMPVCFGPLHGNSAVAAALLAEGCGVTVNSTAELRPVLARWLLDSTHRETLGQRAAGVVTSLSGAAESNTRAILEVIQTQSGANTGNR